MPELRAAVASRGSGGAAARRAAHRGGNEHERDWIELKDLLLWFEVRTGSISGATQIARLSRLSPLNNLKHDTLPPGARFRLPGVWVV